MGCGDNGSGSGSDTGSASPASTPRQPTVPESASESESDARSDAGSESASDSGGKPRLGGIFEKKTKKTRLRSAPKTADAPDCSADAGEADASAAAEGSGTTQPPEAAPSSSQVASDEARLEFGPRVRIGSAPVMPSPIASSTSRWPVSPSREISHDTLAAFDEEVITVAESRAASRAAWKRRGEVGSEGKDAAACTSASPASSSSSSSSVSFSEVTPPLRPRASTAASRAGSNSSSASKLKRSATGMCRPAGAVDSTRCHWLLPPESLSIRVDPETSSFLVRQWLALASAPRSGSPRQPPGWTRKGTPRDASEAMLAADARLAALAADGGNQRRRERSSYPARLHAGWLAQTLRPRGWLASIPEGEIRHLSLPFSEDLVSEPDRGPQRPNSAAVGRTILRELSALAEDHDGDGKADASDAEVSGGMPEPVDPPDNVEEVDA